MQTIVIADTLRFLTTFELIDIVTLLLLGYVITVRYRDHGIDDKLVDQCICALVFMGIGIAIPIIDFALEVHAIALGIDTTDMWTFDKMWHLIHYK